MYYMQFCLQVLEAVKDAECALDKEELQEFFAHCLTLMEEKLVAIQEVQ